MEKKSKRESKRKRKKKSWIHSSKCNHRLTNASGLVIARQRNTHKKIQHHSNCSLFSQHRAAFNSGPCKDSVTFFFFPLTSFVGAAFSSFCFCFCCCCCLCFCMCMCVCVCVTPQKKKELKKRSFHCSQYQKEKKKNTGVQNRKNESEDDEVALSLPPCPLACCRAGDSTEPTKEGC